ncbi:hypothetical protein CBS9595_004203 [Malassezia furfur]|nr:hypothetical protein CBS9595_004203 [Malassezia furfur]
MGTAGRLAALLGFLLVGASFVLQLLNSISLPYIHGLYFMRLISGDQDLRFGVWAGCVISSTSQCSPVGLGFKQQSLQELFGSRLNIGSPFIHNLPYALVLQPISAGFTGIAAGAALLAVCTNTLLYTIATFWAMLLSIATLVIELILFINARNKLNNQLAANYSGQVSAELGPAIWLQVAATAAVVVGFVFIALAWSLNREESLPERYEPPASMYAKDDDPYGYDHPAPNPNRYSDYQGTNYYADPTPAMAAPAPAPAPVSAPVLQPVAAPVMSTGLGRSYDEGDQPYESARGPLRHSLVYDPANAGGAQARRHSHRSDGRRHSHRSGHHSRRHSGRSYHDHAEPRDDDYDYAYDIPARTMSRQEMVRERRRSRDPFMDADVDVFGGARKRHSAGPSFKRYNERGQF